MVNPQEDARSDRDGKLILPDRDISVVSGGGLADASAGTHGFSSSREAKLQMLVEMQREVEEVARGYGLDFFPQHFEVLDYEQLKIIVAQGGFPERYLHMRTGLEYEKYDKQYTYGLAKVYELVINNNRCIGYLLDSNAPVEQRLVMAHVYGHNDFFKNNAFFQATDRRMIDTMADHASRIHALMDRYGEDRVEQFIDYCLSIDDLIDPLTVASGAKPPEFTSLLDKKEQERPPRARRFDTESDYMQSFINPPEALRAEDERLKLEHELQQERNLSRPQRDVMLYLLENAPLKDWEREVLSIIRDEAYYFAPQRMTKIMNEGWASYWHNKMMTEVLLQRYQGELIDYAKSNAGVIRPPAQGGLNPYRMGVKLFEDIEKRWDQGKFGTEWELCDNRVERDNWDKKLGLGRDKIFEVRRAYNDISFLREFLTPELVAEEKLFQFERGEGGYKITSRQFEKVKGTLIAQLVNGGRPVIELHDGNYNNTGQLLLMHIADGRNLDTAKAEAVLSNVYSLWKRPVHILTVMDEEVARLTYDGKEFSGSQANAEDKGRYYERSWS